MAVQSSRLWVAESKKAATGILIFNTSLPNHRKWRTLNQRENLILVCLEAQGLSWPRWRARHPENPKQIRSVINSILKAIPLKEPRLTLACHSGGGSFLWGFLNGSVEIPEQVDRFIFLDANYSFSEKDQHGKKFLDWLKGSQQRRLVVLAYDDRNVLFRGKKVISPTGEPIVRRTGCWIASNVTLNSVNPQQVIL